MVRGLLPLFYCILLATTGQGQGSSNAYLLKWAMSSSAEFQMTQLDLLTAFNDQGYNNQPFSADGELLLSSSWEQRNGSDTDIISLDIARQAMRRITATKDSEYSPTRVGQNLYFVRQDAETGFQELWKYDGSELQKVIPETNVAYFYPISEDRLAVVLIENNQLNLYDINLISNKKTKIIDNAGRCLSLGRNGALYFIHKYNADTWYVKTYDILNGQIRIVCKTIPGSEDFYLENGDYLWMAATNRIYRCSIQNGLVSPWNNIFNLEDYSLNNIGRLCVIGDNQLVFINQ